MKNRLNRETIIVNRVLVAITFAMTSIGRAIGMLDGYSQAKQAAFRIMQIDQRQSQINPHQQSGIILVRKTIVSFR
mgnify:CR=1 FL=1